MIWVRLFEVCIDQCLMPVVIVTKVLGVSLTSCWAGTKLYQGPLWPHCFQTTKTKNRRTVLQSVENTFIRAFNALQLPWFCYIKGYFSYWGPLVNWGLGQVAPLPPLSGSGWFNLLRFNLTLKFLSCFLDMPTPIPINNSQFCWLKRYFYCLILSMY